MASVLVVIPTYNEAPNVERVLRELQTGCRGRHEIITCVADGDSVDNTAGIARGLKRNEMRDLLIIRNERRFQSAAINLAVRRYGHGRDYLVRCDCHATYPPGFVDDVVDALDRTNAASVVVSMDSRGLSCFQRAVAWLADTPVGSGGSVHRGGRRSGFVDHGHHAGFRLERFAELGGYDESFTHNEDAEYDCRLRLRGGKIFLDSSVRVGYFPRATLRRLWRQYFNYGKGRAHTIVRHPWSARLRQAAVPANLMLMAACLLLSLVSPLFLLWPTLYLGALAGTACLLAYRHRSLCGLMAAPAALCMHVSWALGFLTSLVRELQAAARSHTVLPKPLELDDGRVQGSSS